MVNIHNVEDSKGAGDPPRTVPPGAGGSGPYDRAAGNPVTTDRRTPATRIQAGDHVRHCDGQREGLVTATDGLTATVQWAQGGEELLPWGYIEKIPAAVAR